MKLVSVLFAVLILANACLIGAQDRTAGVMIGELESFRCGQLRAAVDGFLETLTVSDQTVKGYIVISGTTEYALMKVELFSEVSSRIAYRHFDAERIEILQAPATDVPKLEFWKSAPGTAEMPLSKATWSIEGRLKKPVEYFDSRAEGQEFCVADREKAFFRILSQNPGLAGKIVIGAPSARKFAQIRQAISRKHAAGPTRQLLFVRHYGRETYYELWLTPRIRVSTAGIVV
jgi:hypothetical protein